MNLVVAGMQFYSLRQNGNPILPVFSKAVTALKVNVSEEYVCFEDKAAEQLLLLVISDFLLSKIVKVTMFYVKEFFIKIVKFKGVKHSPYETFPALEKSHSYPFKNELFFFDDRKLRGKKLWKRLFFFRTSPNRQLKFYIRKD